MHRMFKHSGRHHGTNGSLNLRTSRVLTLSLLFFVGCYTSPGTPISQNPPSQEQKEDTHADLTQEKKSPPDTDVTAQNLSIRPTPRAVASSQDASGANEVLTKGKVLYREHCAKCHGIQGDGRGPLAADLSTKPQNFTKGEYKFRSTMSGELPTDEDLFRTISDGVAGTAMESYRSLPNPDRLALVAYLKSLSPRFLKSPQGMPIIFPVARPQDPESVTRGRKLYNEMQCSACHGPGGRGDGELAQKLTDTAGNAIQPADLTRKRLKSGEGPKAIYRTIMTGLDGTPMPSYGYSLDPEEGWDLALYVYSLSKKKES